MRHCYEAVLERDADGWTVRFPQLGDFVTFGKTREEALDEASDLLRLILAERVEKGDELPSQEHVVECVSVSVDVSLEDAERTHFMTQREAADLLGVSPSRVSALVSSGRLTSRRFEGRNLVSVQSVNAYLASPRKSGRPRKGDHLAFA